MKKLIALLSAMILAACSQDESHNPTAAHREGEVFYREMPAIPDGSEERIIRAIHGLSNSLGGSDAADVFSRVSPEWRMWMQWWITLEPETQRAIIHDMKIQMATSGVGGAYYWQAGGVQWVADQSGITAMYGLDDLH